MPEPTARERDQILQAAFDSFKQGCAAEAGAGGYQLATDVESTVNSHYQTILDKDGNPEDIRSCWDADNAKWKNAMSTVETTGREAVKKAQARSRTTPLTVEAADFTSAASEVQTAKLVASDSPWCD